MRLSVFGTPRKGQRVTLRVSVHRLGASSPVARAAVRLVGSGVSTSTKRTKGDGTVSFRVRTTRRGTVWVIARKPGFQEARLALRVG